MFLIPSESFYQWWLGIPNRQIIIVDLLVCGQCYFLLKSFYLSFNFVRSFSSLKFGNLLGHVIELKFGQTDFPRHLVHINIHTHTHTHKDTHKHKRHSCVNICKSLLHIITIHDSAISHCWIKASTSMQEKCRSLTTVGWPILHTSIYAHIKIYKHAHVGT